MGAKLKIYEKLCEENEHVSCEDALRKAMILECKMAAKVENTMKLALTMSKRKKVTTKILTKTTKTTKKRVVITVGEIMSRINANLKRASVTHVVKSDILHQYAV